MKGGVAEEQGELKAEDLLIFVNEFHFDMARFSLQDCVAMLKSLPPGPVKLGIMRPPAAVELVMVFMCCFFFCLYFSCFLLTLYFKRTS